MSIKDTLNKLQTTDYLQSFIFSDLDASGTVVYVGSQAFDLCWMIQAFNTTTRQMRICMGTDNYESNWSNRASLTYSLPGVVE